MGPDVIGGARPMLKVVFFDAAGTLFEACEPVGHTYARIARRHGVAAEDAAVSASFRRAFSSRPGLAFGPGRTPPELRAMERRWWWELVRTTFENLGEFDDFDRFFDELFAYFADPAHWMTMADARRVLEELRRERLKLGIISNFDYRLYHILDGLGLIRYFDAVTISSEAGFAKPAPEIFLRALDQMGLRPGDALHVGDSEHTDVAGAQGVGMTAALLDPRVAGKEVMRRGEARIASLASVVEIVQRVRTA